MNRTKFPQWPCSVARTAGLLGDPWTLLILRDAHYGTRRFEDFHSSLGLSRNILSERLSRLVDHGLLSKFAYQDRPVRSEYTLTTMGTEFFAVLSAMVGWGDRWLDGGAGAPVALHHLVCGHDANVAVVCTHCGEAIELADIEFRVGPGQADTENPIGMRLLSPPPHP